MHFNLAQNEKRATTENKLLLELSTWQDYKWGVNAFSKDTIINLRCARSMSNAMQAEKLVAFKFESSIKHSRHDY